MTNDKGNVETQRSIFKSLLQKNILNINHTTNSLDILYIDIIIDSKVQILYSILIYCTMWPHHMYYIMWPLHMPCVWSLSYKDPASTLVHKPLRQLSLGHMVTWLHWMPPSLSSLTDFTQFSYKEGISKSIRIFFLYLFIIFFFKFL